MKNKNKITLITGARWGTGREIALGNIMTKFKKNFLKGNIYLSPAPIVMEQTHY